MVNKTIGNHFEGELCDLLFKNGWWSHNIAQNRSGQPADVIAVKNGDAVLIDCKVCLNDSFPLSRIEENQENSMNVWLSKGNSKCYFALKMSDGTIYMIHFAELCMKQASGIKTLYKAGIKTHPTFAEWVVMMNDN